MFSFTAGSRKSQRRNLENNLNLLHGEYSKGQRSYNKFLLQVYVWVSWEF